MDMDHYVLSPMIVAKYLTPHDAQMSAQWIDLLAPHRADRLAPPEVVEAVAYRIAWETVDVRSLYPSQCAVEVLVGPPSTPPALWELATSSARVWHTAHLQALAGWPSYRSWRRCVCDDCLSTIVLGTAAPTKERQWALEMLRTNDPVLMRYIERGEVDRELWRSYELPLVTLAAAPAHCREGREQILTPEGGYNALRTMLLRDAPWEPLRGVLWEVYAMQADRRGAQLLTWMQYVQERMPPVQGQAR